MENLIKYTRKNITLLGILFFLMYSGYGQIQFNYSEQQAKLKNFAFNLMTDHNVSKGFMTYAAFQYPFTNTFYITSNRNLKGTIDVDDVVYNLEVLGFKEYWNNMHMHIVFISGVDTIPYIESLNMKGTRYPNSTYERVGLPTKTKNGKDLHVHAEMNLLSALSVKKPALPANDAQFIVIAADKDYCHRCRAYLNSLGLYVGGYHKIAQKKIPQNWCIPNYDNNKGHVWAKWLNNCTLKYNVDADSNDPTVGIFDKNGNKLSSSEMNPIPENPFWDEGIEF